MSVVDVSSLLVGLIHLFSFILKTKLVLLPSVAEEVSQFSLCCVEQICLVNISLTFSEFSLVLNLNSRRHNYVELLTCDSIYLQGFFVFNRKNRSVKRTETTDSIPGCQLDFVKKKVFLKGLIFKKKGFCNKKKGFPCQMDSFLIPAKGFFTSCILK